MRRRFAALILICIVVLTQAGCQKKNSVQLEKNVQTESSIQSVDEEQSENDNICETPVLIKENIRSLEVISDGVTNYKVKYTPQEDKESYLYWDMVTPYESTTVIDTESLYKVFDTLAGINLTNVTEVQEGTDIGISGTDTKLIVYYYNSTDIKTQEANPDSMMTLLIGNKTENGNYYCALDGYEDRVMLVDATTVDSILNQDPYDLILKIPYLINIASVSEVDINYNKKDYTMTLDGDTYYMNKKKVNSKVYYNLFSDLMQPIINKQIQEDADMKSDRTPVLTIYYTRNMDRVPDYEIKYYEYDDEYYTIDVNGQENFLVSTEDFNTLISNIKDAY